MKPGYKQTEVGMIPEDWERKPLGSFSAFVTKGATPTTYGFKWEDDGVLFLRSECVSDEGLDLTQSMFISHSAHAALNRGEVRSGDILITITGNVGRVVLLKPDFGFANINQHIARIRVKDPNILSSFVFHFLSQPRIRAYYTSITTGQAYPQIGLKQVRKTQVPLPLPPEQHAIAGALSDVDTLIGALNHLIAKKRDFKQAAMQQLLTGQKRLLGFHGEWEVKRLGEITDVDPDNLESSTAPEYEFNYISLEDVDAGVLRNSSEQVFCFAPSRARRKLRKHDILVSTVRPNLKSHLLFTVDTPNWICSTGFSVIRCRAGVAHPGFVFAHLFGHGVSQQINELLTGSNYPAINGGDVRALRIPFPRYEEQTAIAAVLSDMDTEIAALEARRDKTRALKQGMMQELLTGKIRLLTQ